MKTLNELEKQLGYDGSSHYHRIEIEDEPPEIETAHLFRVSREVGVRGIYTFETSPGQKQGLLPDRPVVYVAEARTLEDARKIHRSLWNLSYAPFLVIHLPDQILVYTGFNYAYDSDKVGRITEISDDTPERLEQLCKILQATSIDTGQIWESEYAKELKPEERVDEHLLKNLKKLGAALEKNDLGDETAHALIGKYVYLRYLRDRDILPDAWLRSSGIDPASVFERYATVDGLKGLVEILEDLFNGGVFPIDFDKLNDSHVSTVASIFMGDEILDPENSDIRQLHLDFQAYDFHYIPVETLSAIYEQFIIDKKETRKEKGAIYTPEILADYLLSEVEWEKKLERDMKILDPACGSGVFLVLAYRRLIEKERVCLGRKLTPDELKAILQESIYGVERERDACYVTEFSLILTLLHYLEPCDLQALEFNFPELHNKQIFEGDFFDRKNGIFRQEDLKFDWVVGNPPWVTKIKADAEQQKFARAWIKRNKNQYPVGNLSVAEAFSWRVTDLLKPDGIVGLILPATSLFNKNSNKYRQSFFAQHEVLRITNFANIEVLFGKKKRDVPPAMTVIYQVGDTSEKRDIMHYGPFSVNQVSEAQDKPWVITINENEIQTVSPYRAATGEMMVWKFALWGNHLDERAVRRIKKQFPVTLEKLTQKRGWFFSRGPELKTKTSKNKTKDARELLRGQKKFDSARASKSLYAFSIPNLLLQDIPDEECNIRRGETAARYLTQAPHIVLSSVWRNYIIYSDKNFVIPKGQMGIAAPQEDTDYLKALSVYLNSSLVAFYVFFHVPEWGIYRRARKVTKDVIAELPIPEFMPDQIETLVALREKLVDYEKGKVSAEFHDLTEATEPSLLTDLTTDGRKLAKEFRRELRDELRGEIDDEIFKLLKIPGDIQTLVNDFIHIRLDLDDRSTMAKATRPPETEELLDYARELQAELDGFLMGKAYHRVHINQSKNLIECVVEITKENETIQIDERSIKPVNSTISETLANISDELRKQISQWVYVQRGLRLFDGPRIYIYKTPRLIDWTKTQAMNDAGDIIGQAVSSGMIVDDNNQTK